MLRSELRFLLSLWRVNLMSAMEYRAGFLTQVAGMALNNAIFFVFWLLYFDRFHEVRGYHLSDMFLLYATVALAFGTAVILFGNVVRLAQLISEGNLDYYLSLPRPVLIHALASRSQTSGIGDTTFAVTAYLVWSHFAVGGVPLFLLVGFLAAVIFVAVLAWFQLLAFWFGNASLFGGQMVNALITFSIYPIALFDGPARLVLYTIVPAAFVGSVPAAVVHNFSVTGLLELMGVAAGSSAIAASHFPPGPEPLPERQRDHRPGVTTDRPLSLVWRLRRPWSASRAGPPRAGERPPPGCAVWYRP